MRQINNIVLHCTATPQNTTIASIQRYWREEKGWNNPGYHHIITPDGIVINLLSIEEIANGVQGHNKDSIHISYIGGIDEHGNAVDNRTKRQINMMIMLLRKYKRLYPHARILGHRDFPGVKKSCPSFDVAKWLETVTI